MLSMNARGIHGMQRLTDNGKQMSEADGREVLWDSA